MIIGFTGTHRGMTSQQKIEVQRFLAHWNRDEFHHGDCIGADVQAAEIAKRLFYQIHCHPPVNPAKRGWFGGDIMWAPGEYHERDKLIVDASEMLVAVPSEVYETQRSGTWTTVRYARKQNGPIIIINPFGKISFEHYDNGPKEPTVKYEQL